MKDYKNLQVWSYMNAGSDIESEYEKRFDNYSSIKTNLFINPILRGERTALTYQLFLMPTREFLLKSEKIFSNSKQINELSKKLPPIALGQLFENILNREIVNTNEIEGVKTTTSEVNEAIFNVKNERKKNTRLKSFVRLYMQIRAEQKLEINSLEDIREIYDYLLEGEISEKMLPDGKLFRNSYARIGNDIKTVHLPKAKEEEFISDLMDWVEFINNDEVPFFVKIFVAHYYFEYIHPFRDGNGRTGRYIACASLAQKLDAFSALTFSSGIAQNKKKYYKAFEDVENPKNHGEVTFFVDDMLDILVDGQQELIEELKLNQVKLEHGYAMIKKYFDDKLTYGLLTLYYQAYLYNEDGQGIEDRIVKEYLATFPKTAIREKLDELTENEILQFNKKSPIIRSLSPQAIALILD